MRKLLSLILLLLVIGAANAATVSVSDMTFERDSTGTATILLSGADTGIAGYTLTATVTGGHAEIYRVDFPAWAAIHSASDLPGASVTLDAADLNDAEGGPAATLATIYLTGLSPGTGTVSVSVSSMDDDAGQPIDPATSPGTYSVVVPPGGTDYTLCDGLTIAASDLTSQSVTLSGSTPYSEVWIALGTAPGNYGYQSAIISTNTSSYTATIESFPLVAGETFYARAGCAGGYSPEISFSLPAVTPSARTTYGDRFNSLMAGNLSIPAFWEAEANTYGDQFGGGDFGVMVFVSFISALVFIVLFLRAGDVIIPFMVGGLVAGVIIPYILPEFAEMGYAFAAAALIGIGYSLYRRYV